MRAVGDWTGMSMWSSLHHPAHLRWLLDHGFWLPGVLSLAVSPVGMTLVALYPERRLLRPAEQYVSFWWGDAGLGAAAVVGGAMIERASGLPPFLASGFWSLGALVVGVLLGWLSWVNDAPATTAGQPVYTKSQLLSPTKWFHNTLCYAPLATVLATVTVPAVIWSRPHELWIAVGGRVIIVGVLAGWAFAAVYWDPRHLKPHAHIDFDWRRLSPARNG
jgi:hypothetical protein